MRVATLVALLLTPASALAQGAPARCAPRVEASAAVAPTAVARLTAAISEGAQAVAGPCPLVRFDVIERRLVMTVVLDDGRQVARVLPSASDALPTLVALLATPPMPEVADETAAPEAEPTRATPSTSVAPDPERAPPVVAFARVAPLAPAPARWGLRLGLSGGVGRVERGGLARALLDVEVTRPRWVLGLRASYEGEAVNDHIAWGGGVALALRPRWTFGRWEIDAGPAFGARWIFDDASRPGPVLRAGAEASVAVSLGARWAVFARVDGGADFSLRERATASRDGRQRHGGEADFSWGAALGVRWELFR